MSYYKETGESRCEWCGKYIPVGASYYTHNRNDSYATGTIFCCEEHMHLYDEKTGNKYSSRFQREQEEEYQSSNAYSSSEHDVIEAMHNFFDTTKLKWHECSRCKKYTDCYENPLEYRSDSFFKFQLNEEYYSEFQYLCPDCKYALYAEERKFLNELAKKRAAETQAKREQERQVEEWKERKRKRKRRKIILIVLAVFVGLPLLREAGIKISQAIKVSVEEKSVTKTKQEPKKKKTSKKGKKNSKEIQYIPGNTDISWNNKFKISGMTANWDFSAKTVTFSFSELQNLSKEKTGSLRLALFLPDKEYTGNILENKICQIDIAPQGLESGYGWNDASCSAEMISIPPRGTYNPVIAILEYAIDANGNEGWFVCGNNYVQYNPIYWNPEK